MVVLDEQLLLYPYTNSSEINLLFVSDIDRADPPHSLHYSNGDSTKHCSKPDPVRLQHLHIISSGTKYISVDIYIIIMQILHFKSPAQSVCIACLYNDI